MKRDKHDNKVKLVDELLDRYFKEYDKNEWNGNDAFDVACWFLGEIIIRLCEANIIPEEELKERIKAKLIEYVDDVFKQIDYGRVNKTGRYD